MTVNEDRPAHTLADLAESAAAVERAEQNITVAVNERPRAEITDLPTTLDTRFLVAQTGDYPISGDAIASFLDDPWHHTSPTGRRCRRLALGDLLWPRVRGE